MTYQQQKLKKMKRKTTTADLQRCHNLIVVVQQLHYEFLCQCQCHARLLHSGLILILCLLQGLCPRLIFCLLHGLCPRLILCHSRLYDLCLPRLHVDRVSEFLRVVVHRL